MIHCREGQGKLMRIFGFVFVLRKKSVYYYQNEERAKNLLLEICENVCTTVIRGFHSCC